MLNFEMNAVAPILAPNIDGQALLYIVLFGRNRRASKPRTVLNLGAVLA